MAQDSAIVKSEVAPATDTPPIESVAATTETNEPVSSSESKAATGMGEQTGEDKVALSSLEQDRSQSGNDAITGPATENSFQVTGVIVLNVPDHTCNGVNADGTNLLVACTNALAIDRSACRRFAETRTWARSTGQFLAHLAPQV